MLPFAAARDVSEETAVFLKERLEDYPGVDIREDWERVYPYAPLASHIIGYLGAIPADDESTPDVNETKVYTDAGYNANEKAGSSGIEKSFERDLRGTPGPRRLRGRRRRSGVVGEVLRAADPAGQDVQLTIDLDIQQFAEQALETELRQRRIVTPYTDEKDPKHYSTLLQGTRRLGRGRGARNGSDHRHGELPDVRQPLVQRRASRRPSSRSCSLRTRSSPVFPTTSARRAPS